MSLSFAVVTLVICLLFEAFFSGAELALIAADRVMLRTRAEQRSDVAIGRFLDDPGQLISTALVGTNICVVMSTVVATLSLLPRFPSHAELISMAIVAPLVLVFGEIVPKSLFQAYADRLAPPLIAILSWFRLAFLPIVVIGSSLSTALLRLMGVPEQRDVMSRDELKLLIELPSRKGADQITHAEKEMISRIFEFSETRVDEVMVPLSEVTAIPRNAPVEDLVREIADKAHTRIPLYEERIDQIVGIVHAFDVLRADRVSEVMALAHAPIFVPESQPAVDTLMRLQREGLGMAVVVDEYGGATGIVTIEDIIEEVVGEIEDEYDHQQPSSVWRDANGQLMAQGRATVSAVNEMGRLHLPEDDAYETIAGLILAREKRIPAVGFRCRIGGVQLVVTKATERAIEQVRVEAER